ncbi:hypothetical protein GWN75_01440, partial [candidate division KSB1 bacterium]|nr:hypothetical protein [candidate division KSB1 bacterium]NIW17101.1 hypothetical protein [candidate division KSB1 bacterium]NIW67606.1 hypothetical protein [candidate division KSB1 bacterium]
MVKLLLSLVMVFAVLLPGTGVFASGEGGHAHDHQQQNGTGVVTYVDSRDGVDAYLEVCDRQLPDRDKWTGFVVKC